jgi:hypothetical protein
MASSFHRGTEKLTNCYNLASRSCRPPTEAIEGCIGIEIRWMAPLLEVFAMPTSIAFCVDVPGFEVAGTSKPRGERFEG